MREPIHDFMKFTDLKDMLKKSGDKYGDRPAYLYKTKEEGVFRKITHKEFRDDVNALGTKLIDMGLKDKKIAVINLLGRVYINILSDNPFLVAKEIVEKIKDEVDIIIIDFHAEATGEKITLGHYLDGKVTAIYGTHTHVQTADERILPKGTGFISDIGMTGPKNSALGMDISVVIKRFETALPERYKMAKGECMLNGVIFDIDDNTNKVKKITRINM